MYVNSFQLYLSGYLKMGPGRLEILFLEQNGTMELVFCFVLLFLLKIRYPSGQPITTTIYVRFGRRVLAEYRRLEKVHFRIQKLKLDLEFLHLCKAYDVAPKFLHFKIYDRGFRNTTLYRNWRQTLLEREIRSQEHKLECLKREYIDCNNVFQIIAIV